jgi:tetratricopeptide (TPR) repeat protein
MANEVRSINGACFLALAAELSAAPSETLDTLQQAERLSLTAADRHLAALPAGERQTLARLLGSDSLVRCEGEVAPQGVSLTVEIAQGTALERQSFTAAGMAEIPDLTRRAGQWALAKLGRTATPAREARYAIPANGEAFHDFSVGLSHLADHQPAEARQSLEAALKHEKHPLVYAALADSFTQLGNANGARRSLRAAVVRAALYPPPERQALEAKYSVASARWGDAIEVYSDLERSSPNPFESSYQVAAAYLATANAKEAEKKVAEMRESPLSALDTARLNLLEARAADILSNPGRQLEMALDAAETGRKLGARSLEAEASLVAGRAARTLGRNDKESARLFQRALALASASGDENRRAAALFEQGVSAFLVDQNAPGAERLLREALDLFKEQGNDGGLATAEIRLGHLDEEHGRPGALEHYENALRTFKSLGHQRGIAEALLSRGILRGFDARDYAGADRDLATALEIFREISDRGGEARVLANRGQLLLERGQVLKARQDLEKSLDIRERNGLRRDEAASHAVLAGALLVADDLTGAEDHLGEALDLYAKISADETGRSPKAAQARLRRAVVWLEKGELDNAETELEQLLDLSHQGALPEQGVQLARAQLYLLRGDATRAESALKQAGEGDAQAFLAARIDLAREERRDAALTTLRQFVQDARDRGLVLDELEARLALAEAQLTDQKEAARAELRTIADRANALGAKLLARKAAGLLQPQGSPLSNRILSAFSSRF